MTSPYYQERNTGRGNLSRPSRPSGPLWTRRRGRNTVTLLSSESTWGWRRRERFLWGTKSSSLPQSHSSYNTGLGLLYLFIKINLPPHLSPLTCVVIWCSHCLGGAAKPQLLLSTIDKCCSSQYNININSSAVVWWWWWYRLTTRTRSETHQLKLKTRSGVTTLSGLRSCTKQFRHGERQLIPTCDVI